MHPFHWVPAAQARHATLDTRPTSGYPQGWVVLTLCGLQLPAETGDIPWLWDTCPGCKAAADKIAEVTRA